MSGSSNEMDQLWALIDRRVAAAADKATIDKEIWQTFGEDWAILFTDLSGFSRATRKFGIIHFLQIIHQKKVICEPVIKAHAGKLLKIEADSFLVIFKNPVDALRAAVAMQRACQAHSVELPAEEKVLLCCGLGAGRILRVGGDVFGAEVNAASKLGEDTASTHEILATSAFVEAVQNPSEQEVSFTPMLEAVPGSDENYVVHYPLHESVAPHKAGA